MNRILLLITDLELGGTPTVVRELAIRLSKVGQKVEVACLSRWGPVADQLKLAGVTVTALAAQGPGDLRVIGRLIQLIREHDVQTVFSFLMHANVIAAVASLRVSQVRWIQSIQTTQPWPRWHWFAQRFAQRATDTIVVPSQSVADAAQEWSGVSVSKIRIIPNAIDPADWQEHQSNIPTSDPRPYPVTFIGRLDPVKDVPTLVRAVAQLSPLVHLNIYGQGADEHRIKEMIRSTNAPATLHGPIASPMPAMSRSGLLVLPSLAEGFGLVLIEAMAAGVPVIGTDVPGIRDVVRDGQTGLLVPAGNSHALGEAIEKMVSQPALRQSLVQRASADLIQRFSWERVILEYVDLLESVDC